MPNPTNLTNLALRLKAEEDLKNSIIDANIAETKADFAQYHETDLDGTDGAIELYIDYDAYDGTNNNSIYISVDGGATEFTTAEAKVTLPAGQVMPVGVDGSGNKIYNKGTVYYTAHRKDFEGNYVFPQNIAGANAYEILRKLGVANIMDV